MNPSLYNVKTLPKWAQSRIETLERSVEYHKKRWDRAQEGKTEVWLQGVALDPETPLPAASHITFRLNDPEDDRSQIQVYVEDDKLHIYGYSIGVQEELSMSPRASNHFVVRLKPYGT